MAFNNIDAPLNKYVYARIYGYAYTKNFEGIFAELKPNWALMREGMDIAMTKYPERTQAYKYINIACVNRDVNWIKKWSLKYPELKDENFEAFLKSCQ